MASWRDQILSEFTPYVALLTLVADPDGLLLEEGVLEGISGQGFELIPFEDHITFRYAYESRFRSHWDRGEETELAVVVRVPSNELDILPYDLLQAGRRLSFSLSDLFPMLSYPVVAALDITYLDALFDAQMRHLSACDAQAGAPGQLGDNATKDFILHHVFEVAPELIKQPSDLLRVLLRRHYRGQRIPAILDERLIQVLRQNSLFEDWPLETIISDAQTFFAFLQERWIVFLDLLTRSRDDAVHEDVSRYSFKLAGPAILPFDHDDVRIYIDNLFLDGLLKPVYHEQSQALANTWVGYGIKISPIENHYRLIEGLLDSIEKQLPTDKARHGEWLHFAYRWAKLIALGLKPDTALPEEYHSRLQALRSRIDSALTGWVLKHYAPLINLPPIPPVMLHHIPRYLARGLGDDRRMKIALLLVDGLALDQWIALSEVLGEIDSRLRFKETVVFAWIPTITSVSRQATFAGKPPIYFPTSIHTTEREAEFWTQFWIDYGFNAMEVTYAKGLGDGDLDEISELLSQPKLRVVGLVIDKVDRIMHGMELGAAGMHNQVRQWARQGFIRKLLDLLHTQGFKVYLASDHGNIEAKGVGRPAEGVVADLRGERVRIYSDSRLRAQIKGLFPDSLEWPTFGLPEDYLCLIAPNRAAFVREGETIVGHGGISLEELFCPFVQIDRRD